MEKIYKPSSSRKNILIVEGDKYVCMYMCEILKGGYDVEFAADGAEGLEKIKQKAYDIIVSDIDTPGRNGEKFYKEMFASNVDLTKKVIFASGYLADFIKSNGYTYIEKPFRPEQLTEAIKKILE